jgi:hypothetical protein
MMGAKFTGILLVITSMLLIAMAAATCVQIYKEFYDINIIHYLQGLLFFFQFPLYLMIVLAVFFYVITRNKFIAMFMMVLYLLVTLTLPNIGLENYLYRFRETNPVYSDFTGYPHHLEPYLWQTFYWAWFACLMILAIYLLWPRGAEDNWPERIKVAKQRLTPPLKISIATLALG